MASATADVAIAEGDMVGDGGNAAPGAAESPVLAGVYVHPSHGTAPPVLRGFVAHAEQNQRATMEDRCGVWETLPGFPEPASLLCVFDGHGGSSVAEWCSRNAASCIAVACKVEEGESGQGDASAAETADGADGADATEARYIRIIRRAFELMDSGACAYAARMQPRTVVGSTAVLALVTATQVFVANVGDSRAVQVRCKADGRFIPRPLSRDHKPSCADERQRIEQAGGFVSKSEDCMRVNGVLATSRAIGDKLLKPYVNAVPEITRVRRLQGGAERDYLILATDGLWDDLTLQESAAMVEGLDSAVEADASQPAGAAGAAQASSSGSASNSSASSGSASSGSGNDGNNGPSLVPRAQAPAVGPSLVPSSSTSSQAPDDAAAADVPPRRRRRTQATGTDATAEQGSEERECPAGAEGGAEEGKEAAEAAAESLDVSLARPGRARALSLSDTPNPVMPDAARGSRKRQRSDGDGGGSEAPTAGQAADSSSSPASGERSAPGPTPQEILVRYTRLVTRRGAVDNISIVVAAL